MTKSYVMLADITRCINCKACVVACRAEWQTPLGRSRDWVREVESETAGGAPRLQLFPGRCQHCEEAPCVEACPSGAAWKREDGVVLVEDALCSGCELCVPACPYEARWLNPATNTIGKCTFCQPRIDAGLAPACVQTCVGGALTFGDAADPGSGVSRQLREKRWVQLVNHEVAGATRHYYHTGGEPLPEAVMPRHIARQPQGAVLAEVVNPVAKIGLSSMVAAFVAAGVVKLFNRRAASAEKGHGDGE